jgi:hypothetical protein
MQLGEPLRYDFQVRIPEYIVTEVAREQSLSKAMVYRLLARYRLNPSPSELLPKRHGQETAPIGLARRSRLSFKGWSIATTKSHSDPGSSIYIDRLRLNADAIILIIPPIKRSGPG